MKLSEVFADDLDEGLLRNIAAAGSIGLSALGSAHSSANPQPQPVQTQATPSSLGDVDTAGFVRQSRLPGQFSHVDWMAGIAKDIDYSRAIKAMQKSKGIEPTGIEVPMPGVEQPFATQNPEFPYKANKKPLPGQKRKPVA